MIPGAIILCVLILCALGLAITLALGAVVIAVLIVGAIVLGLVIVAALALLTVLLASLVLATALWQRSRARRVPPVGRPD